MLCQPPDDLLARRARQVHGHRFLSAVAAQEVGAIAHGALLADLQKRRAPRTSVVAGSRALDLDHLGAEVREHLRGVRTREDAGEVEDANALECCAHAGARMLRIAVTAKTMRCGKYAPLHATASSSRSTRSRFSSAPSASSAVHAFVLPYSTVAPEAFTTLPHATALRGCAARAVPACSTAAGNRAR